MWTFILLGLTVAVAIATPPHIRLHSLFICWWLIALLLAKPYGTEWWHYDVPMDWSAHGGKLEAMRGVEWEWRRDKPPLR